MLKTLPENFKNHWKSHIKKLTFAYNNTKNKTTVTHRLSFDLLETKSEKSFPEYVENWRNVMKEVFSIISRIVEKSQTMNKRNYNKKVFGLILEPNDRVLLRNVSERGGTGKLRSYWEKYIYIVVSCNPELPIYKIKPENGNKPVETVHRNLLLKFNELPLDNKNFNLKKSASKTSLLRKTSSHYNSESENEIESDTEFVLISQNIQKPNPLVLNREEERRDEIKKNRHQ